MLKINCILCIKNQSNSQTLKKYHYLWLKIIHIEKSNYSKFDE